MQENTKKLTMLLGKSSLIKYLVMAKIFIKFLKSTKSALPRSERLLGCTKTKAQSLKQRDKSKSDRLQRSLKKNSRKM